MIRHRIHVQQEVPKMKAKMGLMLLLAMMMCVTAFPLFAQEEHRLWSNPSINGTTIRQGLHIEWFRSMAVDPETNNMCVTWSDTRLGNRDVFAQLYDENGEALWAENGILVSGYWGRQEDPHVMPAGNGEWIISWIDYRFDWEILDNGDVFIQKLDADGNRLWQGNEDEGYDGLPVCVILDHPEISVQSFTDEAGGAVSIWVDGRSGNADLYVQHINSDGTMAWEENGIAIISAPWDIGNTQGWKYTADIDGQGGLIAAAHDTEHSGQDNFWCQRVDIATGELMWGDPEVESRGIPLCIDENAQTSVKMAPDGLGGAFFVWNDKREDELGGDIWGQHLTIDGTKSWMYGIPYSDGFEYGMNLWEKFRDTDPVVVQNPVHSGDYALATEAFQFGSIWDQCMIRKRFDPVEGIQVDVWFNTEYLGRGDNPDDWGSGDAAMVGLGEYDGDWVRVALNDQGQVRWILNQDGMDGAYDNILDPGVQLQANTWYKYTITFRDDLLHVIVTDENENVLVDGTGNVALGTVNNVLLGSAFLAQDGFCYFDDYELSTFGQITEDQFNMNGTVISAQPNVQEGLKIVNSGPGEAVLVWQDERNRGEIDLFGQKMSLGANNELILNWNGNEDSQVCDTPGEQVQPRLVPDGQGGVVLTWIDLTDDYNMFIQHIDPDGTPLWNGMTGLVISDREGWQEGNLVRMMGDDRTVVVYSDKRQGSLGLFYQIFDMEDGSIIPGMIDDGTEIIFGIDYDAKMPKVASLNIGEYAIFGWLDSRFAPFGKHIFLQKVDYNTGNILWEENGISITPGFSDNIHGQGTVNMDSIRFDWDADHTIYAVWEDNREIYYNRIAAQKIDPSDGSVLWGGTGVLLADEASENDQKHPFILSDGNGGATYAFLRIDDDYYQQIRMQAIDSDGNLKTSWNNDEIPGISLTSDAADHDIEDFVRLEDGSTVIVYYKLSNQTGKDLYAQRISTDGELLWDDGVPLCTMEQYQHHTETITTAEGVLVIWEDGRRGSPVFDIYGQLIDLDGNRVWPEEQGKPLVIADNAQINLSMGASEPQAHSFWIAWEDWRGQDAGIYTQRFDLDGNPVFVDDPEGVLVNDDADSQTNPHVIVNPDQSAFITWQHTLAQNFTDLRFVQVHAWTGEIMDAYPDTGAVLCDAYHQQKIMSIKGVAADGDTGFVAVWEDLRATGKDPLYNIYAQRVAGVRDLAVDDETLTAVPSEWKLEEAYPNPFNPSTQISYTVPENALVKLTVYDVLGRVVSELVNGYVTSGQHQAVWNGRDLNGRQVASGKYFYRLTVDGKQISRSVILLK